MISKSSTIKLALVIATVAIPASTKASELKFNDKTWPVDVATAEPASVKFVRNNFSVKDLATSVLTGSALAKKEKLLAPQTVAQIEAAASEINRPAVSANLEMENDMAKEFEPGQLGQSLDVYALAKKLDTKSASFDLPVYVSYPDKTLSQTNSLGINELVAIGESDFTGSSRNRVTNITVGASKFNGLILKPGEEFSFNKFLGDVDGAHGFKPEIVIKREGLVPEYGGGLCQVSSTAFRAAMNGGMNITERRNHSFVVRYYSPTGSDATIYAPLVDLKFTNDFPSHLLIRTRIDLEKHKLFYEYYGTKDDRQIVLEGPFQFDRKSDGSVKTVWTKKVTKDGETVQQDFRSTYVSASLYQKVAKVEDKPSTPPATPPTEPAPTPVPEPVPNPNPSI